MDIQVFETKDYSIFKKLNGNRDIKSVNKIVSSVKKVGYIPSPICVNEKMEIVDGQNRLEAFKALNIPVHYYVVENIGIEEARQMNIGRRDWTPLDYVKSYAAEGNPDYIRFLQFINKYERYTFQELYGICKDIIISTGWATHSLKDGTLEMTAEEIERGESIIEYLDEIRPALTKVEGSKRMRITGFAWMLGRPNANKKRIIKIVNEKYPLFVPAVSPELMLKDFSDHYNKKLATSSVIWFDVEYRLYLKNGGKRG